MKLIIFTKEEIEKIINYFVAYDFSDFTVFLNESKELNHEYYKLNDINVTVLNGFSCEKTVERLKKIKGSVKDKFVIVYSNDICYFDFDSLINFHNDSQKTVTILQINNKLSSIICENEVFDYFHLSDMFECDIIKRLGEEGEIALITV